MKRLLALLLVVAALLSLSACGGEKENATTPQNQQNETKENAPTPQTEVETPALPQGSVEGKTYTAGSGLTITLPEEDEWAFLNKEDFPEEKGSTFDAAAFEAVNGSTLHVYYRVTTVTPEQYLTNQESTIKSLSGKDLEVLHPIEVVEIDGKQFTYAVFHVEAAGLSTVEHYLVRAIDGGALEIAKIIIHSSYDETNVIEVFGIHA